LAQESEKDHFHSVVRAWRLYFDILSLSAAAPRRAAWQLVIFTTQNVLFVRLLKRILNARVVGARNLDGDADRDLPGFDSGQQPVFAILKETDRATCGQSHGCCREE
jgi:hypothetical protein